MAQRNDPPASPRDPIDDLRFLDLCLTSPHPHGERLRLAAIQAAFIRLRAVDGGFGPRVAAGAERSLVADMLDLESGILRPDPDLDDPAKVAIARTAVAMIVLGCLAGKYAPRRPHARDCSAN